jgi:hypothetical protein
VLRRERRVVATGRRLPEPARGGTWLLTVGADRRTALPHQLGVSG